jgi:DUF4097 and DUF4098 domain-containing protein YvlB
MLPRSPGRCWAPIFVLLGLLASAPLAAQKPADPRQRIDRRFAVASDASIRLFGGFAKLRIIGWDRDSLVITGTMGRGWRLEGNAMSPGPLGPSRGAKFFIEGPAETDDPGAALEVRVPAKARVWAKSGSADIEVTGVTGGLDLNIVGGSVTVHSAPRELNIESMDGNVKVLSGASWLRVKTATGEIDVRGGAEDVGLSSVGGTVRLMAGKYERAKFETVTGDIVYEGEIGFNGSLDMTTHSGRVELRVPSRPDLELDATTVTGAIENTATDRRPITGREGRGMELAFSSGSGDTRVVVRSFKGNVVVRPR